MTRSTKTETKPSTGSPNAQNQVAAENVFCLPSDTNFSGHWDTIATNMTTMGVKIPTNGNINVLAVGAGTITAGKPDLSIGGLGNDWVILELDNSISIDGNNFKYVYYGNLAKSEYSVNGKLTVIGKKVKAQDIIGLTGNEYLEIGWGDNTGNPRSGPSFGSGSKMRNWLRSLKTNTGEISTEGSIGTGYSAQQISISQGLTGYLTLPGIFDAQESQQLTGVRGMMNDQSIFEVVQNITNASLRRMMSLPDGKFYAFYPDYFGSFGATPHWEIADIEIISGKIDLSDDSLATHVFVVGDVSSAIDGQIELVDKLATGGVVTIFNAFMAGFIDGPGFSSKDDAIQFLKKYGARPVYKGEPYVRAPIYEAFLAYQKFCLLWAQQFQTEFELTFMPELYPGGIVSFPEHGIQCFVEAVSHNCDYQNGFTTNVVLIAPSAIRGSDGKALNADRSSISHGMIRPITNDEAMASSTSLPISNNKGKWTPK